MISEESTTAGDTNPRPGPPDEPAGATQTRGRAGTSNGAGPACGTGPERDGGRDRSLEDPSVDVVEEVVAACRGSLLFKVDGEQVEYVLPLETIVSSLSTLSAVAARFHLAHPEIENLGKFRRYIVRELRALLTAAAAAVGCPPPPPPVSSDAGVIGGTKRAAHPVVDIPEADVAAVLAAADAFGHGALSVAPQYVSQARGAAANARGLWAEMLALALAPGVVGVSIAFGELGGASGGTEVDIVARGGHSWLEVKGTDPFDTHSSHWTGNAGHVKGLREQIVERLNVAAAPCNALRWQAPSLVVYFPCGCDPSVAEEVESLGARVVSGIPEDLKLPLPAPPPPPTVTNLDVTALCALVTQVSHADDYDEVIAAWASRVSHWQECLEAERKCRFVQEVADFTSTDRELVVASSALHSFQKLVDMFAGPLELERWAELQARLKVVEVSPNVSGATRSRRVDSLTSFPKTWKDVFGLGDALRAVTLTANGRAVRNAALQGVSLETHVHRAAWLTKL